jgi:hypothetical protein
MLSDQVSWRVRSGVCEFFRELMRRSGQPAVNGYMGLMFRPVAHALGVAMMVALPVAALFTGGARLVPFLAMPLVVLGGPLVMKARGSRRGESEADAEDDDGGSDGGGGNCRPGRGPSAPSGPMGELPLEFSSPAAWRLRGNGRQRGADPGRRRRPHPLPVRSPRRVPSGPYTH